MFFGCYIEEGGQRVLLGGIISFLLTTIRWFMGALGDHDCESTLFWHIFEPEVKSCVKRMYFGTP